MNMTFIYPDGTRKTKTGDTPSEMQSILKKIEKDYTMEMTGVFVYTLTKK